MFADTATIEVRAGKGGDGRSSFRHEKFRALGGPDGGDGGRGGSVIARVDHNLNTLTAYRHAKTIRAEDGQPGGSERKHGKSGADITLAVPQGTQIWSGADLLADLATSTAEATIARGGRGGFGNAHFKSSTRQAPRQAEFGDPGEAHQLRLELKMVADVGLIGLPNAGKSTLLSVISAAKPEIGDYAFTTLVPNLGVVDQDGFSFLAADIPGLIAGASQGKGLGHEFLRHIERTTVLLQLVDGQSDNVAGDWRTVDDEVQAYGHDLGRKPRLVVLTKIETLSANDIKSKLKSLRDLSGEEVFAISAQAHQGLPELLRAVVKLVQVARADRERRSAAAAIPVINTIPEADHWTVAAEAPGTWRVIGRRIETFARRTNFTEPDAVRRLHNILVKLGIAAELRRQGAAVGDTIHIGPANTPSFDLTWLD